jgi:hypothetical protein
MHETPYWKRAHHDWRFWVAMVITFAAIAMYVMSDDLSLVPRGVRQGSGWLRQPPGKSRTPTASNGSTPYG